MKTRQGGMERFRAYTLAETLAVLLIVSVLAGAVSVIPRNRPDPEKEANSLAFWLTNLTVLSNRSGRPFRLSCPGNVKQKTVGANWQRPERKDTYTAAYGCVFTAYRGVLIDCIYSPQWGTLTPTATIKVEGGGSERYVIISQHGRVRISAAPPPS